MKKKIVRIVGVVVLLFVLTLIAAPFFLKGKIADIIKNKVNNNITGTLDFSEADLSLFSSFPKAKVSLKDISLVTAAPFAGDTLFASKEVELTMGIGELFKDASEPIGIRSLTIDGARLQITIDSLGIANYDIAVPTETVEETEGKSDNFSLALESYEITNSEIRYTDLSTGLQLELLDLDHSGSGDLSLEKSELDTHTNALVSFQLDSTNYLNKNKVQLDALLGMDLKANKYSFLKNEAVINQLPLVFEGYVQVNEDNQEVDISFETPSSGFKNFLAVLPEAYARNIENVQTTGNFTVAGVFKGVVDEEHIPTFDIRVNSDKASFKYPDLPKSVEDIAIQMAVTNKTGISEDTYVEINRLKFRINSDSFNMTAKLVDLLGNTKVNAHLDAKMDLSNISKAYPMPEDLKLQGILDANVTTAFDMASVENKRYGNTSTKGRLQLSNFQYSSEEFANPIEIKSTALTFDPETVTLNDLSGQTGKTDFKAKGTLTNLLGFLFNNEKVVGDFDLESDTFALNDFMVEESSGTSEAPETTEKIKIPSFLDCTIRANAATVLYDNLALKDVSGTLRIRDEKATLSQMSSSLFDGKLALNGEVSTKAETPTFAMKLGMDGFRIGETFEALELFKALAPVASALRGKLNSDVQLSGNLKNDFTPNLSSVTGNVLAELLATEIKPEKAKILSSLSSKLSFLETDKLNLKGLKTALSFEDGLVKVKPFTVMYEDIAVNVSGSHTFDNALNYTATLDVPTKYLGSEVNNLIAKIDDEELENMTVPISANIGGSFGAPTVSTDLSSGVKNLTAQLVEVQKQKLLNQGKDQAKELIGNILSGNSSDKDSTVQTGSQESVTSTLGNLLGDKQKDTVGSKTDSSATSTDPVKKAAKGILGNLLGKKKKKEKDSVN
ncbi:AsmA-like C-terminal region-containing protein [Spongiimicrobium sp. 2-473A-2-J]|uniref:AsmA-like C-terminal region-containing protein n=1 Tax=Eudoraea algarum TaxID=3417568 RepID=UPI003D35D1BE